MHILVVTMYYAPDRTGIPALTTELCEFLAACGHKVSVTTGFPHYPAWKVPERYQGKLWLRETISGVEVYRGYVYVPARPTTVRRILYETSLAISAMIWGLKIRKVDLVLGVTTPLQAGVAGSLLARIKKIPFVLQVQDLLPDLAIALGMLRNRYAIWGARKMEMYLYRRARLIAVLCQGFLENIKKKGIPGSKLVVVPAWVDTSFIRPVERNGKFRAANGLTENQFVVLHTGNMGAKQKLTVVLEAAAKLQDDPHAEEDTVFLLVGDGAERTILEEYARQHKLNNVRFLPLQPREQLPEMLSAADLLLLNQSAAVVDMVIPSKLLVYMAAGRAVVAAVNSSSEAADCIRRAGCGVVVPPENADALVSAIRQMRGNPDACASAARSGRAVAEREFGREDVLRRFEQLLRAIAPTKPGVQETAACGPEG